MPVITEVSGFVRFTDMIDGQTDHASDRRIDRSVFAGGSAIPQNVPQVVKICVRH